MQSEVKGLKLLWSTGNKFKDKSTKVTSPFDTECNWEGFLSKIFCFLIKITDMQSLYLV